jgi:hypothetical protein
MKLGTCHIIGCGKNATMVAAPNVHYCERHAASDLQATRQYMSQLNGFHPQQDPFREIKNAGDGKIEDADGRILIVGDLWPEIVLIDETVPFGRGGRTTRMSSPEMCERIRSVARA